MICRCAFASATVWGLSRKNLICQIWEGRNVSECINALLDAGRAGSSGPGLIFCGPREWGPEAHDARARLSFCGSGEQAAFAQHLLCPDSFARRTRGGPRRLDILVLILRVRTQDRGAAF